MLLTAIAIPDLIYAEDGLHVAGIVVYPVLDYEVAYNDNVIKDTADTVKSTISVIEPGIKLQAQDGLNTYTASYQLSKGIYHQSRGDDYVDHTAELALHHEWTSRFRTELAGSYQKAHDERGTNFTGTAAAGFNTPDKYHRSKLHGLLAYGAKTARVRLEMEGRYSNRRYDNHRSRTNQRDMKASDGSLTAFYRLQPHRSVFAQVKYKKFNYTLFTSTRNLDSTEQFYYAGVDWKFGSKSYGRAKAGFQRKNFADLRRNDFSSLGWELEAGWAPHTYSRFLLTTSSLPIETDGSGSFIKSRLGQLVWQHALSKRLHHFILGRYTENTYVGDRRSRKDKNTTLRAKIDYKFMRWLTSGISYTYKQRNSNVAGVSYHRNVLSLYFEGAL